MVTISEVRATVKSRPEWKSAVEVASHLRRIVEARLPHDARKFLDLDHWLEMNLKRAEKLGLFEAKGGQILDLGSGTGQFLFVCETLGHQAIGLDLPTSDQISPEREIFAELPAAFTVHVQREAIRCFQELNVPGKFDLITSFMVCFNNHKLDNEWGQAEWAFFVRDMISRLNPGGRIALRLNHHEEKFGPGGYLDDETQSFFSSLGSINDGEILITPTSRR